MYERQVAQAKRMIKKYANNQLSTWRKSNESENSSQPWNTTPTSNSPTDYKVYIVFLQPGTKLEALFHLMQGTSVPIGAPSGLMAEARDALDPTKTFEPDINDTVIDPSGEVLVIKDFNIVKPDGVTGILYKLDFS